ncbi:DNA helicase [Ottowia sp.]|uniref:DNA helicase n=1 Tax=Ottowia sp. TaxID=1898956 RepID=UPI0039E36C32
MKLSAPIYILKQQAKALSRQEKVRLNVALDRIATREGYIAWSHLASSWQRQDTGSLVYRQLQPGDLILVGARPGHGKTLLGLGLAVEAMAHGNRAALFTLEDTTATVEQRFDMLGKDMGAVRDRFLLDTSEDISPRHIAERLAAAPPRTLVVIDYLQLLDQRRDKPALDVQVRELKACAEGRQAMVVCLSQISRDYAPAGSPYPGLQDVRLPNPVDLALFSKACFLHGGKMQLLVGSWSKPGDGPA